MPSSYNRKAPPGPRFNPLSLMLRGSPPDVLGLFTQAAREYGEVVCMRGGLWSVYLVTHPNDVKHVLHDNHANYRKTDRINVLLKPIIGEGLLTSDGDLWRHERRLIQPAFHRQRLAALETVVTDAVRSMLERWRTYADDGQPLEVLTEMRRVTFGILGKVLFDTDIMYTDETDRAAAVFFDDFDYRSKHFVTLPRSIPTRRNRRLREALRLMDKVVDAIVDQGRPAGESTGNLLSMLLRAEHNRTNGSMSRQQVRDEVATFIRVGYETPAVALAWTWYFLAKYPEVDRKLRAEIAEVLGARTPTFQDIPQLKYTKAVVEESMRLCPPVWALSRQAIDYDELGGYYLPARSVVILCPYITHRHPAFWDHAEDFDPERFMADRSAGLPRGAYLPFGGGPRRCIGDEFAMIETQLIIAMVAQKYRLDLVAGHPVEPVPIFTLRPRYGVRMTLHTTPGDSQPSHATGV